MPEFLVKDPLDPDLATLFNAGSGMGLPLELAFANLAVDLQCMRKLAAIEKALNVVDPAPGAPVTEAGAAPFIKLAQTSAPAAATAPAATAPATT